MNTIHKMYKDKKMTISDLNKLSKNGFKLLLAFSVTLPTAMWQDHIHSCPMHLEQSSLFVRSHGATDRGAVIDNLGHLLSDQTYFVNVDKIEMDRYQVNLKVKSGSDQPELCTIRAIWNDVGSSFKLAFEHSGKSRMLVPKG